MSAFSVFRTAEACRGICAGWGHRGSSAILSLKPPNWVGNVILPVYGGIEIARAVLGVGGFFETPCRQQLRCGGFIHRRSLPPVGLMRLMEHFVTAAKRGGLMALRIGQSRNLHAKVTLLGLELEDMLFLAAASAGAMLVGQFFFSDRYMFFLPMNWFLLLMVLVIGVPCCSNMSRLPSRSGHLLRNAATILRPGSRS